MTSLFLAGLLSTHVQPTLAGNDDPERSDDEPTGWHFESPDALRMRIEEQTAAALRLGVRARFVEAHRLARDTVTDAAELPQNDIVRLKAEIALGTTLWWRGWYRDAEWQYTTVYERVWDFESFDELLVMVEVCSHLGDTHQALGDLPQALEWHGAAWQLLTEHEVFHAVRFQVAAAYANAASEAANHEGAIQLREWVLTSRVNEFGEDHVDVAADRLGLARTLLAGGGDPEVARTLLEQALATYEAHDDVQMAAITRTTLAETLLVLERPMEAREVIEQAMPVLAHTYDADERVMALHIYSTLLIREGRYREAAAEIRELLAVRRRVLGTEHALVGRTHAQLAAQLLELGELAEAEAEIDTAVSILTEALGSEHPDVARARLLYATVAQRRGRLREAEPILRELLPVLEADPGSQTLVPMARLTLGHLLDQRGEVDASRAMYEAAVAAAEATSGPNHPDTAAVCNAYGVLLLGLGELDGAEAQLRRALGILERTMGPEHPRLEAVLDNLASLAQAQGRFATAQRLYERSLSIALAAVGPDHLDRATTLGKLGGLHLSRGDIATARQRTEQALEIRMRVLGADHPGLAFPLTQLANIARADGRFDDARHLVERAVELRRTHLGPRHPSVADSLDELAFLHLDQQQLDAAEALFEESLAITREAFGADSELFRTATSRFALARITTARRDYPSAAAQYVELLDGLPDTLGPTHPTRRTLRGEIALLKLLMGRRAEARVELETLLAEEDAAVADLIGTLSDRERLAMVGRYVVTLERILQAHAGPDGDPETAWSAVLKLKGRVKRSLTVEEPGQLLRADPEAYARWQAAKAEVSDLVLSGVSDPVRRARLVEVTAEKEALRRHLATRAGASDRGGSVEPRDLCAALEDGEVVVDIVRRWRLRTDDAQLVGQPVYTAFVAPSGCATTQDVVRVELGDAEVVDAAITRHRALLAARAPTSRIDRAGEKVRQLVWDPVASTLDAGVESVFVVPDGAVATVAFGALPTDAGAYLIETLRFRSLDTALDLVRPVSGWSAGGKALVVGGVDYGEKEDPSDGVADAGLRGGCAPRFPALPGTSVEADAVTRALAPHGEVVTLTKNQATEAAVREAAAGASTIHLATHGFFASDACRGSLADASIRRGSSADIVGRSPMALTGVALSGASADPSSIWTAEEIAGLPLSDVDLVVLSACETGLGETRDGQGVLGLQRAFALSGARATVMSLWPVEDAATRRLMDDFYTALLGDPDRDESRALHDAALQMLAANREHLGEARPETWAAFIVAGAPR